MDNRAHTDGSASGANGDPSGGGGGFSNLTYHYDQVDTGSEIVEDQPGMLPYNKQNAPPPGQANSSRFVYPPGTPYCPPPIQHPDPPPPQQQQQQQQQQQVVISGSQDQPQYVDYHPAQPFCCHITLSCFVFWLFLNPLFGTIAFILAAVARNRAHSDRKRAIQLGRASYGVSVVGIIVTVVTVCIVVSLSLVGYNGGNTNQTLRTRTTTTTTTATTTTTTTTTSTTTTATPGHCPYYNITFCYPYALSWRGIDCAFGVSVSGKCYYDMKYSCSRYSTDADHNTRGNCYKVSTTHCQDAVNYNNGVCYKYALKAKQSTTCHATYIRNHQNDASKYCYYSKREHTSFCTGDISGGYCYYN